MEDMLSANNNYVLLLESIRAGIPSRLTIESLPDLRENVTTQIDTDLEKMTNEENIFGRIVWGEYGQGKTHFLKTIEQHVLRQGFAVSYYTLNRDSGLNNLKALFPMLTSQTMTGEQQIPGIMNQLTHTSNYDSCLDNLPEIEKKITHPLPAYILKTFLEYHNIEEMLLLYSCLMGNLSALTAVKSLVRKNLGHFAKQMPKFNQKDHAKAFFEFYPYLLQSLGYKGWVILLDEIELIGKLGKVGRLNSYLNLAYLLNCKKQHNLPIYVLAASAKTLQTDVFYGKKNDVDKMPAYAKERLGDKAGQIVHTFFEQANQSKRNLQLTPVYPNEYMKLYREIFKIHKLAVKWVKDANEDLIDDIIRIIHPDNTVRMRIRMFIELLDIYSFSGSLISNIKELHTEEYDLTKDTDDTDNDKLRASQKGFKEKPLHEMFDDPS